MSSSEKIHSLRRKFLNLFRPQITREMRYDAEGLTRDGTRNDYPDYLIQTVTNSPHGTACVRKKQQFVTGRGIADESIASIPVNEEYDFNELHRKISKDFAFSDRFAVIMIPSRGGQLLQMYCVPFEAVRLGIPDEKGNVWYAVVNYQFNTYDYNPADNKYYPLFSPAKGFQTLREDRDKIERKFTEQPYSGHLYFYNRLSEQNRTYSRPDYFSAHDFLLTDYRVGVFHERNVDNNFFLGGVLSIVGDPAEKILDEQGNAYTTVGQEFDKQLAATMSGAANSGKILTEWVQSPEFRSTVSAWPGQTNHEQFIAIKDICREVIATAFGVPQILLGIPTAGKLGDNQEIRNAIKFLNETTEDYRRTLKTFYEMAVELMRGEAIPEEGITIERIKDWVDLPEYVFNAISDQQREQYLADQFGIITPEPEIIEPDADIPDNQE